MKKKSILTKILSTIMTCVLFIGLMVPIAAIRDDTTADIVISGVNEGTEISAYRVITVNVNNDAGQPASPMYKWNDEVAKWLKANGYSSYVLADNNVSETFKEENAGDLKGLWHKLAKAIKSDSSYTFPTPRKITSTGEQTRLVDSNMGEYLITANGDNKVYLPTTATLVPTYNKANSAWVLNDAYVGMKGETPSIEKTVPDVEDKTVSIGDVVSYKLKVTAPNYPEDTVATTFYVGDKMSEGLTFNQNSVKVYRDAALKNEVLSSGNYVVNKVSTAQYTFRIEFTKDFITNSVNAGEIFYITYNATINQNAEKIMDNKATLTYSNDPYDSSTSKDIPSDTVNVYTYGLTISKVDTDNKPLTGAEFKLLKEASALTFTGSNGTYKYDPDGTLTELSVGTDGTLNIIGIDIGTYTLQETKAPNGFTIPTGNIQVMLNDTDPDGILETTSKATASGTYKLQGTSSIIENKLMFGIVNSTGFDLPVTGGTGTIMFTICGLALMGGAAFMIVVSKRKALKK